MLIDKLYKDYVDNNLKQFILDYSSESFIKLKNFIEVKELANVGKSGDCSFINKTIDGIDFTIQCKTNDWYSDVIKPSFTFVYDGEKATQKMHCEKYIALAIASNGSKTQFSIEKIISGAIYENVLGITKGDNDYYVILLNENRNSLFWQNKEHITFNTFKKQTKIVNRRLCWNMAFDYYDSNLEDELTDAICTDRIDFMDAFSRSRYTLQSSENLLKIVKSGNFNTTRKEGFSGRVLGYAHFVCVLSTYCHLLNSEIIYELYDICSRNERHELMQTKEFTERLVKLYKNGKLNNIDDGIKLLMEVK